MDRYNLELFELGTQKNSDKQIFNSDKVVPFLKILILIGRNVKNPGIPL